MTTTDKIMSLADDYATAFGVFSETRIERRETLRTEIEKLVSELDELKAALAGANEIVQQTLDAAMEKQP